MEQPRYHTVADLLAGGAAAHAGAGAHGIELELQVVTKQAVEIAVKELEAARDAHALALSDLAQSRTELKARIRATSDALYASRDLLKPVLGKHYSTAWHGTGFDNSLVIPRYYARLYNVAGTFKGFIETHPELEREGLLTAAMIETSVDELRAAKDDVTLKEAAVGAALTVRRGKEKLLRLLLRWLKEELGRKLDPLDDRWTAFGFNKPGLLQTPDVPQKVEAVLTGENAVAMRWGRAPRAFYYRVWIRVIGADGQWIAVGRVKDRDFTVERLPRNVEVEVAVSAVNSGGESQRTAAVLVRTL